MSVRSQVTRVRMAHSARRADPESSRGFRGGLIAGLATQLGIAALVVLAYATARNHEERALATMAALLELPLVPGVLVLALVRAVRARTRPRARGLAAGTGLGLLVVLLLIGAHDGVTSS